MPPADDDDPRSAPPSELARRLGMLWATGGLEGVLAEWDAEAGVVPEERRDAGE